MRKEATEKIPFRNFRNGIFCFNGILILSDDHQHSFKCRNIKYIAVKADLFGVIL